MAERWRMAAVAMVCGLGAIGASGAAAQTGSSDRVLRSFTECRAVRDPAARLACFDRAASALEAAVKAKDVTILDRQDIGKAKRSLFGFTIPRTGLFGGGREDDDKDEFVEINTTVVSAGGGANGRATITIAEGGAVWQTTESVAFLPKAGMTVRIRKAAMGGYFLRVDGRAYRAMRLR